MQRLTAFTAKTQCRYCGESISTNNLSTHIRKSHRLSVRTSMVPKLVRKPVAVKPRSE